MADWFNGNLTSTFNCKKELENKYKFYDECEAELYELLDDPREESDPQVMGYVIEDYLNCRNVMKANLVRKLFSEKLDIDVKKGEAPLKEVLNDKMCDDEKHRLYALRYLAYHIYLGCQYLDNHEIYRLSFDIFKKMVNDYDLMNNELLYTFATTLYEYGKPNEWDMC